MRTTSSTILRQRWSAQLLHVHQHEYGIQNAEDCDDFSLAGAEVRAWINLRRGYGHGDVMPLVDVQRWASARWYDAHRPRELRGVRERVTQRLLNIFNDARSGVQVVKLAHRCVKCGAE